MDGYLGEVKMFAGNYPPKNWAYCQGQLLNIMDYQALYSVMGTAFGGDGRNTFAIPDLRGRTPVGSGTGTGLTPRTPGQFSGYESITLTINNLPPHTHTVNCDMTTGGMLLSSEPENRVPAKSSQGNCYGEDLSGGHLMNQNMVNETGGGQPIPVMQPWLCINYIICLLGTYPPRN